MFNIPIISLKRQTHLKTSLANEKPSFFENHGHRILANCFQKKLEKTVLHAKNTN